MKVCLLNNWLKDYNGILSKISFALILCMNTINFQDRRKIENK